VFNRHLECIRERNVKYMPISHAWHHQVSTSQQSHTDSIDAARLVYQTPIKILQGLARTCGLVEIWHDYISASQWHQQVHQQLLLAIPRIYALPERMIVHLDDVKIKNLERVHQRTGYHAFLVVLPIHAISVVFGRLWSISRARRYRF
jgi:hypothetical protein